MNEKEPKSEQPQQKALKNDQRRARRMANLVCFCSVVFLIGWFASQGRMDSPIVWLYSLTPLIIFLIINWAFRFTYKKGKD
ncbi:hypothetical protein [Companilactobacillus ginsenosidimutans]|uniref:Uncharacterized protein n=1 Tax=Companilactobacillus ginsenosidimutans TaxID=1007676 RepID=A0A0H4QJK8_9LACO|nr:hypothetical protein [Companilactobacillus ginsenosidimutans]AKP68112.1 hypothetical protein ABM34_11585 [Companilactobacillus ginsenosidimutans]